MAEQTFSLIFDGYWLEVNKGAVPSGSGIYCVYACTHNESQGVSVRRLLYIGEAADVRTNIANHESLLDWKQRLNKGETLCYSFAKYADPDRTRCAAALINRHQPPANTNYRDAFPFEKTSVNTTGANKSLENSFTVHHS